MKNLLILQGWLPFYRKPFFNRLSKYYRVTVVHSGRPATNAGDFFLEIILPVIHFGSIRWQTGLAELVRYQQPDAIVAGDDLHYLAFAYARFLVGTSVPWAWWGVDENRNRLFSQIKFEWIIRKSDQLIFYDTNSMSKVSRRGLDKGRLHLANNTVFVKQQIFCRNFSTRNTFVNVGSLNSRKQNDVLIKVFAKVLHQRGRDFNLYLIGDGPERERLRTLIKELDLTGNVTLTGKIEDSRLLAPYYSNALASVSFGQAGLAVLQSMAYGVPFITKVNAISGGEISNIENGKTGILCEDSELGLLNALLGVIDNPALCEEMGANAYTYYRDRASVDGMVEGFRSALSYGAK
jgi:glycosyltransferase involved in cell wall biosynthesis